MFVTRFDSPTKYTRLERTSDDDGSVSHCIRLWCICCPHAFVSQCLGPCLCQKNKESAYERKTDGSGNAGLKQDNMTVNHPSPPPVRVST